MVNHLIGAGLAALMVAQTPALAQAQEAAAAQEVSGRPCPSSTRDRWVVHGSWSEGGPEFFAHALPRDPSPLGALLGEGMLPGERFSLIADGADDSPAGPAFLIVASPSVGDVMTLAGPALQPVRHRDTGVEFFTLRPHPYRLTLTGRRGSLVIDDRRYAPEFSTDDELSWPPLGLELEEEVVAFLNQNHVDREGMVFVELLVPVNGSWVVSHRNSFPTLDLAGVAEEGRRLAEIDRRQFERTEGETCLPAW